MTTWEEVDTNHKAIDFAQEHGATVSGREDGYARIGMEIGHMHLQDSDIPLTRSEKSNLKILFSFFGILSMISIAVWIFT